VNNVLDRTQGNGAALVGEGFDLLLYGMGTVFVFLVLLVVATRLMSTLIVHFFPEQDLTQKPGDEAAVQVDPLTLKIIQAALDKHRHRK